MGIGGLAQDMEIPQADNDSQRGMPDMATNEAEDSSEDTPRSVGGNSSIADTPCSPSATSQAAKPEATSSDGLPRETIVQGEPDQTGSKQLVAESKLDEAGSKSAEAEADPTGSDETGARQEESDAEQGTIDTHVEQDCTNTDETKVDGPDNTSTNAEEEEHYFTRIHEELSFNRFPIYIKKPIPILIHIEPYIVISICI